MRPPARPLPPDLDAVVARMGPCPDIDGVSWLGSRLSDDRRRMVCECEASDGASVRALQHEAGARFDRTRTEQVVVPT